MSSGSTSSVGSAPVAKFQFHLQDDMALTSIVWSPDGRYIAASSTMGNKIHVWDLEKRKRLPELERTAGRPNFQELSWDAAAGLAVCDGRRGIVRFYDAKTWTVKHTLPQEYESSCVTSAFSADGKLFAVLGTNLSVYKTTDWTLIKTVKLVDDVTHKVPFIVRVLTYLPGTHTLVLGGDDRDRDTPKSQFVGHVFILKAEDPMPSTEFSAYTYTPDPPTPAPELIRLAVSPDGKQVATGTRTGSGISETNLITDSVHIFSLQDGRLLGAPLDGQGFGEQEGLSYTPDGHYLIVAHGGIRTEHVVHIIDAQKLRVVDTVRARETVYGLAVRPDSSQFAVSAGGGIDVWSLRKNQ
jgi:WD40 repeat protein